MYQLFTTCTSYLRLTMTQTQLLRISLHKEFTDHPPPPPDLMNICNEFVEIHAIARENIFGAVLQSNTQTHFYYLFYELLHIHM